MLTLPLQVLSGDFTFVISWAQNYMGICMVYKVGANIADFQSSSAYCYDLSTSGFGNAAGYTFFGQYHAPIANNGQATAQVLHFFKYQRSNNILTLQYSTSSNQGPWSSFTPLGGAGVTLQTAQQVIVIAGEAGDIESRNLRMERFTVP